MVFNNLITIIYYCINDSTIYSTNIIIFITHELTYIYEHEITATFQADRILTYHYEYKQIYYADFYGFSMNIYY